MTRPAGEAIGLSRVGRTLRLALIAAALILPLPATLLLPQYAADLDLAFIPFYIILSVPALSALAFIKSRHFSVIVAAGILFYLIALPAALVYMPGFSAHAALWAFMYVCTRPQTSL